MTKKGFWTFHRSSILWIRHQPSTLFLPRVYFFFSSRHKMIDRQNEFIIFSAINPSPFFLKTFTHTRRIWLFNLCPVGISSKWLKIKSIFWWNRGENKLFVTFLRWNLREKRENTILIFLMSLSKNLNWKLAKKSFQNFEWGAVSPKHIRKD